MRDVIFELISEVQTLEENLGNVFDFHAEHDAYQDGWVAACQELRRRVEEFSNASTSLAEASRMVNGSES